MWALSHRATNDTLRGALGTAADHARSSLEIAEEIGSLGAAAYASYVLIGIEAWQNQDQGRLIASDAARLHAELAPIAEAARGLGDRNIIGHVLQVAGLLSLGVDDTLARTELDEALAAFGDLRGAACTAHGLEMVALVLSGSDPEGSLSLLSAAETLRDSAGVVAPPLEREIADMARAAAGFDLDPARVARAVETGAGVSLAEAVALGRELLATNPTAEHQA